MYTQLLAIVDLAVKQAIITTDNFETEFVSIAS